MARRSQAAPLMATTSLLLLLDEALTLLLVLYCSTTFEVREKGRCRRCWTHGAGSAVAETPYGAARTYRCWCSVPPMMMGKLAGWLHWRRDYLWWILIGSI